MNEPSTTLGSGTGATRPETARFHDKPGPLPTQYRAVGKGVAQVGPWREFMTLAALDLLEFPCGTIEVGNG